MQDKYSWLDEVLDSWVDDVEMIVTDPDLNHAQSLEARSEADTELKAKIIQALEQSELEGRLSEIGGVQLDYGHQQAMTWVDGKLLPVKDRYDDLESQLKNIKTK